MRSPAGRHHGLVECAEARRLPAREHIKLWLSSRPPREKFYWSDYGECVCGQYSAEYLGDPCAWYLQRSLLLDPQHIQSVVDDGTSIDSGGGDGIADLWPVIGGIEYHIAITKKGRR